MILCERLAEQPGKEQVQKRCCVDDPHEGKKQFFHWVQKKDGQRLCPYPSAGLCCAEGVAGDPNWWRLSPECPALTGGEKGYLERDPCMKV